MAVLELAEPSSPELALVDSVAPTEEVISPELALVDPELRARALARLEDPPWLVRPALRLVLPPEDAPGDAHPARTPVPVRAMDATPEAPSTAAVPQRSELAVATAVYVAVSAVHFAVWGLLAVLVIALSVVLAILI